MTEERYWAALFGILHDGGIDDIEELVGKIDDDYETGDEADAIINDDGQMIENGEKKKQLGRTPIAKLGEFVFSVCHSVYWLYIISLHHNIATSKPQSIRFHPFSLYFASTIFIL